jgi:galactokinase
MGGGFGGCTINIVKDNEIDDFLSASLAAYKKQFHIEAEHYEVNIVDGTAAIP